MAPLRSSAETTRNGDNASRPRTLLPLERRAPAAEPYAVPLRSTASGSAAEPARTEGVTIAVRSGVKIRRRLTPKGASLRCRIELAAAILLQAIDHAHDAATETGMMEPDDLMKLVIDLVERRALEIWDQGGA